MSEPAGDDPPPDSLLEKSQPTAVELVADQSRRGRRLRTVPALAIAAMLVAGGLLMAVGGMVRLIGPAPATPAPAVVPSPSPAVTPAPTIGPSHSPLGDLERGRTRRMRTGGAPEA